MAGLYRLYRDKHNPPPDFAHISFLGKTILITGATSGLGFETALKFLRQGVSSLIISTRDYIRGQQTKEELESRTGRRDVVEVWPLDMSSFQSVIEFASRVNEELLSSGRRLDVAVLNAGVMHRGVVYSEDGWEDTLQVNTLSTALLAGLLLPTLQQRNSNEAVAESDVPHLVIVSSGTALRVRQKDLLPPPSFSSSSSHPLLDYLNQPSTRKKYAISKLVIEYVSRSIADQTINPNGSLNVIINTVKPGLCASALGRQYTTRWYERWAQGLFNLLFARSAEVGGRILVSACVQGYECHGRMWKGDGLFE